MPIRERQQTIICLITVIMIGGFITLRYLPLERRIKDVEQKLAAKNAAIVKLSCADKQLPKLEQQLAELQKSVGNYELKIPESKNLGNFLQRIADLMNRHNLTEQLVKPGREVEADQMNYVPVSMQCKGSLAQIFEFCKSLQAFNRLIRIVEVKLENGTNFNGEVRMQTKAVIYRTSKTS